MVGGNKNVEIIKIFLQLLKMEILKKLKDFLIKDSYKTLQLMSMLKVLTTGLLCILLPMKERLKYSRSSYQIKKQIRIHILQSKEHLYILQVKEDSLQQLDFSLRQVAMLMLETSMKILPFIIVQNLAISKQLST